MNRMRHGQACGFSLIELLVVMFIIGVLMAVAVPNFAQFNKTSKVDQAAQTVITALYHARSEAQRTRTAVAVYFGDEPGRQNPAPAPGVLPGQGSIELWTVRSVDSSAGFGTDSAPYAPEYNNNAPAWYPFRFPDRKLDVAYSLPQGVRVIACGFYTSGKSGVATFPCYKKDPLGEIKRHHIVFVGRGSMPLYLETYFAWFHLVVFDAASGEHVVIEAGRYESNTRPRILSEKITHVGDTSAGSKLKHLSDLANTLDHYPGNS